VGQPVRAPPPFPGYPIGERKRGRRVTAALPVKSASGLTLRAKFMNVHEFIIAA